MGGVPPFGYTCRDHKLILIDSEAETVRDIFRRYAALGSVRLLKEELDAAGIHSKSWTSSGGRHWGGQAAGPRRTVFDAAEPDLPRRDRP